MSYHYTINSSKKSDELITRLEASLKEEGFGILWNFKMHEKLAEKGFPNQKSITILEVCNPAEAAGILEIDTMASYFLPCKIVVMEEENETKLGLLSPKVLLEFMDSEKLSAIADEIENRLIGAIDRAV